MIILNNQMNIYKSFYQKNHFDKNIEKHIFTQLNNNNVNMYNNDRIG
jgi:hypothetical protein